MKRKKILRVFEWFAWYWWASFALKRLKNNHKNFNYNVVAYSEIDKYAAELFDLNHKNDKWNSIKNYWDITLINPQEKGFPDFDLFTWWFPCQPFSTAGMQKWVDDPYWRWTLFQHIIRICSIKKPRYILMENVKWILSKKFSETRKEMEHLLRELWYVSDKNNLNERPLAMAVLNSKDYWIPQNRERVRMFARLWWLPKDFSMTPPKKINDKKLWDFLDPKWFVPHELYLSKEQIEHLKVKHKIDNFFVDVPLCLDIYNKKIKRDWYCITITMPEHNSLRVLEPHKDKEVVRKMSVTEQFRLMWLEWLEWVNRNIDIKFWNQSYTQLSKRAWNWWDVNLVSILLEHIFSQLKELDSDLFDF